MVIYDYDIPEYDIWHMMIDKSEQGKGYGKIALQKVIDYIREKPVGNSDRIALTCNKRNQVALKIYKEAGFEPTGNSDGDEIELAIQLS